MVDISNNTESIMGDEGLDPGLRALGMIETRGLVA